MLLWESLISIFSVPISKKNTEITYWIGRKDINILHTRQMLKLLVTGYIQLSNMTRLKEIYQRRQSNPQQYYLKPPSLFY